jgi:FkbM family methyltransferase
MLARAQSMLDTKSIRRHLRKVRNNLARRFFDTRYGRNLLINSLGPRVQTMTIDCGDHVMSFSPGDYIGKKIFRKGHFEREHVDRLLAILKERGLLRDGTTLLELGGNIGTQTVYFALSGHFARIVSVEPDPRNFDLLRTNVIQNGLGDCVIPVNCAAGENQGEIDFFQHPSNHGKSSASRQNASDSKIVVPVKPVGSILAEAGTNPEDVGLIWMDIEGYEPLACHSMQALLAHRVPLCMEFSPTFYGPDQSAAFVQFLAGFYDDCLIFREDNSSTPAKVRDIPINERQFDVLLFDTAV